MKFILTPLVLLFLVTSCGDGKNGDSLAAKKEQLSNLRAEFAELKQTIQALEKEISDEDPNYLDASRNAILVSTLPVDQKSFEHRIEVRGTIESRKNVVVGAEASGRIMRIEVKEGEKVKKGQVIMKIDDRLIRDNIAELQTALDLAVITYERQANIWEQRIGSEIQYLQAKNQKETLERRLETARTQLEYTVVRAPFAGSIEELQVKEGEMSQMGMPLYRLVSLKDMYIQAAVSERYIGKFEVNEEVRLTFPSSGVKTTSRIKSIGQVINPENRTFTLEINLPEGSVSQVKPNMVVVVDVTDYKNDTAYVLPTRLIQSDAEGRFIYLVEENDQKTIARKKHVETGVSFNGETEIKSGIMEGTLVINQGFREASDGAMIQVSR
jgi:RND family efflux transporter MFP subunit